MLLLNDGVTDQITKRITDFHDYFVKFSLYHGSLLLFQELYVRLPQRPQNSVFEKLTRNELQKLNYFEFLLFKIR